jgi:hypothetical protein
VGFEVQSSPFSLQLVSLETFIATDVDTKKPVTWRLHRPSRELTVTVWRLRYIRIYKVSA